MQSASHTVKPATVDSTPGVINHPACLQQSTRSASLGWPNEGSEIAPRATTYILTNVTSFRATLRKEMCRDIRKRHGTELAGEHKRVLIQVLGECVCMIGCIGHLRACACGRGILQCLKTTLLERRFRPVDG